jgi:hypothetical protein
VNNVPFWWVVKHRDGGYLGEHVDKHVQHQREAGRHMVRGDAAGFAAWWDNNTHRVVKVHARIPEPKLPAWVKPVAFQYQEVQVWRRTGRSTWEQHVFPVTSTGNLWVSETVLHTPTGAHRSMHSPIGIAPDIWAEAAQRAAKMLRARKAGK